MDNAPTGNGQAALYNLQEPFVGIIMATISFIGAGNLGGSLVRGLIKSGFDATEIAVSDRYAGKAEALAKACPGIAICASNHQVAADCQALVFCVKPDDTRGVCKEISDSLASATSTVLVSVSAGVTLAMLSAWTRGLLPLVRCMPNTPAVVGYGMSVLYAGTGISETRRRLVERIFNAVGKAVWVGDEALMDAATALSGSGPAYFFRVMEALERVAMKLGFDAATAKELVAQTALGAAQFARRSELDVSALREMVTSKGGTTERAIASLERQDIDRVFEQAIRAAAERSREISRSLSEDG